MKITATQLKQIIAEEIKRAQLTEEQGGGGNPELYSSVISSVLGTICDEFKSQFDPMDPSMDAAGGRQVWEAQCDAACEPGGVLDEKIEAIIMQAEEDLHSGKYYRG
jgi:hypothetical protein